MNFEKYISSRVFVGQSNMQVGDTAPQVVDHYRLPIDLPNNPRKRQICVDHIRSGAASALMRDFIMSGVHFSESTEPQEITTQLSCEGVGCIIKRCGLKIEQFDSEGQTIREMKAVD